MKEQSYCDLPVAILCGGLGTRLGKETEFKPNSWGAATLSLIHRLSHCGIKLNVTAILTWNQIMRAANIISGGTDAILSVFMGRIMDTGCPPSQKPLVCDHHQILWASTREPYNIWQADLMGYDIITVPDNILAKARQLYGYDLNQLSLETVQMFKKDSEGYTL